MKHLGDGMVDPDWRGKVWANGHQVLHHVDRMTSPSQTLMLTDARGGETGWFFDVDRVASILSASEKYKYVWAKVYTILGTWTLLP